MVAHAGHVLIDLAVFAVPVGAVVVVLLVANLRGRRERSGPRENSS
ncbi:MAG: hypothetical protein ACRDL6_01820 [Solirubrobacterales bacterium]